MASRFTPLEETTSIDEGAGTTGGRKTQAMDNRPTKKKRIYDYKYCSHCESYVSKSTYYAHSKTQKDLEILVDDCDSFSDETANCSSHVSSPLNLMAESSSTGEEGIPAIKYLKFTY